MNSINISARANSNKYEFLIKYKISLFAFSTNFYYNQYIYFHFLHYYQKYSKFMLNIVKYLYVLLLIPTLVSGIFTYSI